MNEFDYYEDIDQSHDDSYTWGKVRLPPEGQDGQEDSIDSRPLEKCTQYLDGVSNELDKTKLNNLRANESDGRFWKKREQCTTEDENVDVFADGRVDQFNSYSLSTSNGRNENKDSDVSTISVADTVLPNFETRRAFYEGLSTSNPTKRELKGKHEICFSKNYFNYVSPKPYSSNFKDEDRKTTVEPGYPLNKSQLSGMGESETYCISSSDTSEKKFMDKKLLSTDLSQRNFSNDGVKSDADECDSIFTCDDSRLNTDTFGTFNDCREDLGADCLPNTEAATLSTMSDTLEGETKTFPCEAQNDPKAEVLLCKDEFSGNSIDPDRFVIDTTKLRKEKSLPQIGGNIEESKVSTVHKACTPMSKYYKSVSNVNYGLREDGVAILTRGRYNNCRTSKAIFSHFKSLHANANKNNSKKVGQSKNIGGKCGNNSSKQHRLFQGVSNRDKGTSRARSNSTQVPQKQGVLFRLAQSSSMGDMRSFSNKSKTVLEDLKQYVWPKKTIVQPRRNSHINDYTGLEKRLGSEDSDSSKISKEIAEKPGAEGYLTDRELTTGCVNDYEIRGSRKRIPCIHDDTGAGANQSSINLDDYGISHVAEEECAEFVLDNVREGGRTISGSIYGNTTSSILNNDEGFSFPTNFCKEFYGEQPSLCKNVCADEQHDAETNECSFPVGDSTLEDGNTTSVYTREDVDVSKKDGGQLKAEAHKNGSEDLSCGLNETLIEGNGKKSLAKSVNIKTNGGEVNDAYVTWKACGEDDFQLGGGLQEDEIESDVIPVDRGVDHLNSKKIHSRNGSTNRSPVDFLVENNLEENLHLGLIAKEDVELYLWKKKTGLSPIFDVDWTREALRKNKVLEISPSFDYLEYDEAGDENNLRNETNKDDDGLGQGATAGPSTELYGKVCKKMSPCAMNREARKESNAYRTKSTRGYSYEISSGKHTGHLAFRRFRLKKRTRTLSRKRISLLGHIMAAGDKSIEDKQKERTSTNDTRVPSLSLSCLFNKLNLLCGGPPGESKETRKSMSLLKALKEGRKTFKPNFRCIKSNDERVRPTPEEAEKWATSFATLMESKYGRSLFKAFMAREYCDNNVDFWLAVEDYKRCSPRKRKKKAETIYMIYVSVQSPKEINIDAATRSDIRASLASNEEDIFNAAQKRVQGMMENGGYSRFLASSLYRELLISEST